VYGTAEAQYSTTNPANSRSFVIGGFTLVAQKAVLINHYVSLAQTVYGLGSAASSGLGEVYTEVEITKVA
jgi:hypothetical protein